MHDFDSLNKDNVVLIYEIFSDCTLTWLIRNIKFYGFDFRSCLKSFSAQEVKKCVKSLDTLRNIFSSSVWS